MSVDTGDSQDAASSSDPEDEPPVDSDLSHHSLQPVTGSAEGIFSLMPGPPVGSTAPDSGGADGGSAASHGPSPASTGRGRHGASRAHRRRESPPPPPPPPEFGDSAAPEQPDLRIPSLPAAVSEVRREPGSFWAVVYREPDVCRGTPSA